MSTTSWAEAPVPAIPADQFPDLLAGLVLAESTDRSVLTVVGIAPPLLFRPLQAALWTVHAPP